MSNKQNILFRADSSSSIGIGHIMRDIVLAKQFEGSNIYFASEELEGNIIESIPYQVIKLKSNTINELDALIKELNIDMIVIDHYDIDYKFEKQLKTQNSKLKILSLDDTYEKHYCDILLNHNIYADEERYKELVPLHCILRCGSKYTLIRDEFLQESQKPKSKNKKYKKVFVAMGGADTANINIKILKVLKKIKNIKVNLITTTANQNLNKLKKYCKDKKWINLHINSNKVANLMRKSDFAIITPSVTLNEIYFMNLPFVAIKVATNQDEMYNYLKKSGYLVLKKYSSKKLTNMLETLFVTQGVVFKNFTSLDDDEAKMVLEWRNSQEIRRWMYNSQEIELQTHLTFINSLKDDKTKYYFLLKQDREYIGVIDLTNINDESAEIGVYKNPSLYGVGDTLMHAIIGYGFGSLGLNALYAEVFKDNKRAYELYTKHNFKKIGKKIINNKEVYRLELKR